MRMKIICMILALTLAVTGCFACGLVFPASAAQALAGGTCGENIRWTITDDGTLTVGGAGAIEPLERQVLVETITEDESGNETSEFNWETEDYYPWDDARTEIVYKALGYADMDAYNAAWETEEIDSAAVRRLEYSAVRTLVVEEGIDRIECGAFMQVTPQEITLPASLKKIDGAFLCGAFAKSITIKNPKLDIKNGIEIYAYEEENAPYETPEAMVEAIATDTFEEMLYSFYLGEETVYEEYDYNSETGEMVVISSTPMHAYPWLTVYGGKDSTAQTAAQTTGVAFVEILVAETEAEPAGTWEKIKAFFFKQYRQIRTFFEQVIVFLKSVFAGVKQ